MEASSSNSNESIGLGLRGSFLSRVKVPVRSKRRRVPSVKPAMARRPLGTSAMDVPDMAKGDDYVSQ